MTILVTTPVTWWNLFHAETEKGDIILRQAQERKTMYIDPEIWISCNQRRERGKERENLINWTLILFKESILTLLMITKSFNES